MRRLISALALVLVSVGATAAPVVNLSVDGSTWSQPFVLENLSQDSSYITDLKIDLASLDLVFDKGPDYPGKFEFLSDVDADFLISEKVFNASFNETFDLVSWFVDVDFFTTSASYVEGSDLIGASVDITFNNGLLYKGQLVGVEGNDDASTFAYSSVVSVPTPASIALLGLAMIFIGVRRAS